MSRPTGGSSKRPSSNQGPSSSRIPSRPPRAGTSSSSASIPRPRSSRSLAKTRTSPISSFGALAVVAVVLLAGLGYGYTTRSSTKGAVDASKVKQLAVSTSAAVCQALAGDGIDFTTITAYSPGTGAGASTGAAAGPGDTATATYLIGSPPLLKFGAPGTRSTSGPITNPVTQANSSGLPWSVPVFASANGAYAPGFSVGEVVRVDSAPVRGLAATPCTAPSTDFWFAGVALGADRSSTLDLANTDNASATVNLTLYNADGVVDTGTGGQDIQLAPHTFTSILLNTLVPKVPSEAASVRVKTQIGRVAAAVFDSDEPTAGSVIGQGMDFIPAQSAPGGLQAPQIIPGIPVGQPARIDLTLTATGTQDASVDKLEWISPHGTISLANATQNAASNDVKLALPLTVKVGTTLTVDLHNVPADANDAAALRITSSGSPLLAGIRIVAAAPAGTPTDTAYLAPAQQITGQSVVVDNKQGGKETSVLYLSSVGPKGAVVKVTRIGGTGTPVVDTVTVPANQTVVQQLTVPPGQPAGQTDFTTIIDVQPGSNPVYAARQITDQPANGGIQITEQVLTPIRLTASVPPVEADLSGAVRG